MANYIFETMSASDAASFQASDYLFFFTTGANATNVTVTPRAASGLQVAGIDLSYGGKTLTFPATTLSPASTMNPDHIIFNDQSTLLIGTGAADAGATTLTSQSVGGSSPTTAVVYGLGGSDSIQGGAGNDYLYGGTDSTATGAAVGVGGDTIVGGNGNNHIYGNSITTVQGATDGNDSITAGTGSNYINGNAGADVISVGTATSSGSNRIFGGAGNDSITVNGNGSSRAAVNGNAGDDTITDSGTGTNTLRGGAGSDTIIQSAASHDVLMGDAGADTLRVSGTAGHVAVLTGGADADTFDFGLTGSGAVATLSGTTGATVAAGTTGAVTYYQEITDFVQGTDTIHLGFTVNSADLLHGSSAATFTTVSEATVYAQQLLDNNTSTGATTNAEVAAVNVGSDTYLFYSDTAGQNINSIIKLDAINQNTLTQTVASHTFG